MLLHSKSANDYVEEVFCRDGGYMDFREPVEQALDRPTFQAIFNITGYLLFGDDDRRPVNDTYAFISIDTDNITQDFMLQRIRFIYGVDTGSIGSIVEFQWERAE